MNTLAKPDPLLLAIIGPTGSGKTALAIALAMQVAGEIVNCDSVALYRDFEIGTAKPSREERAQAPHHLLDVADPSQFVNAGDYARMAREALADIKSRGRMPIVAGGTGLYLRALLEGLFAGPPRSEDLRERLRERAAQRGSGYLHRVLARLDREAAGRIHSNDVPKLVRALEVCLTSREPMSELLRRGRDPLKGFRIARIGLDPARSELYARINRRAQQMFQAGLVEETRTLSARYGESAFPLRSLGYAQALQLLHGELTREQAIAAAQQAHRNYAKRQMTWFRREPGVHWLAGFGDDPAIQQATSTFVFNALNDKPRTDC